MERKIFKKHIRFFIKFCADFAAAKEGVVGIIFALSLIPLVLAVGLTIDLGRAYLVKQRLANTTDAAGLAIGAAIDSDSTTAELQTVLDNYTEGVSNSQRYKMLGNGWTVDVIVHILGFI